MFFFFFLYTLLGCLLHVFSMAEIQDVNRAGQRGLSPSDLTPTKNCISDFQLKLKVGQDYLSLT